MCGDKETLLKCFQKSVDASESVIQACLTKAGCTQNAATNEASYLFSFCQGEPDELKRRQREGKSTFAIPPLHDLFVCFTLYWELEGLHGRLLLLLPREANISASRAWVAI